MAKVYRVEMNSRRKSREKSGGGASKNFQILKKSLFMDLKKPMILGKKVLQYLDSTGYI